MNKLFNKIASLSIGLALAIGVGVAIGTGAKETRRANAATTTYTFTSKAWADTTSSWTSDKDGYQLSSGRGVQVSTTYTGAGATSKSSFAGVSNIQITYSTNASSGAGKIAVKIGTNTAVDYSVTSSGGTTDRITSHDYTTVQSGKITFTVTCSTNSIYVKSIKVTETITSVLLDGDNLGLDSTATTAESTKQYSNVTYVISSGAKSQSKSGSNQITTGNTILIGKSGAYIYNSTAFPGDITKFEMVTNGGASTKVTVGVKFSTSAITTWNATGAWTNGGSALAADTAYDLTSAVVSGAKFFRFQVYFRK